MDFQLADTMDVSLIDKDTSKVIFKGTSIPSENFSIDIDETKKVRGIKLGVGIKIEIRDTEYEKIINDKNITDKYKLNVKRLNRWWYSIYFDKKDGEFLYE